MPKFDQRMTFRLLASLRVCAIVIRAAREGSMDENCLSELSGWIIELRTLLAAAAPGVALPPILNDAAIKLRAPTTLPVLDYAPSLDAGADGALASLMRSFTTVAGMMRWRQTYRPGEADAGFLERYGWTELAGADGLVRADKISAGLLLLGPQCYYPAHSHPAHEIYVPLSGTAAWFDADRGWREVPPLQTIVHRSGVAHAMRTAEKPLLAYFHWSGDNIGERARFA
ncbi:dimethylsulfonioproprionate lyase family protein [Sphingopyxis sp. NJF-3]